VEAYPTTPGQHAEVVHPLKSKGLVFVGRKTGSPPPKDWKQDAYEPWELEAVLHDAVGLRDLYLTMNRFGRRRKVLQQHVREIAAAWGDLDYYNVPELRDLDPEVVYVMVLERLREAGVPEPSLVISSGQGLYLIWLHTPRSWKDIPRWQDCQHKLWRLLEPMGADANARDAARVLRVVGTVNGKNGGVVRALRDAGPRRSFEELAGALLPAPVPEDEERPRGRPAELYDLRVQRAVRREYQAPKRFTERSLWLARWVDLQTWRRLRFGEEEMGDFRDRWLFLAGVAMSWITDPPEPEFFERELVGLAEEAGGWNDARTRSKMQSVLERVRLAARGETVTWEGSDWDARYAFKTETIIERLGITPAEQREMFNLIGADEKRRRNTDSRRQKRRAAGARPRAETLRLRRRTAHDLRDRLQLSTAEIAQVMVASDRSVRRWLK
jgi:hypothetical protein